MKSKSSMQELSFIALFALMFSSMMGSGVFDIPQNMAHKAGAGAIVISWIITTIGMLALGAVFMYLVRKRPDINSGIYGYAKYGFGDYVGFNSAFGYWLNALLGNASYLLYIFATIGQFAAFSFFGSGNTLTALIFQSLLIWVIFFQINAGIREAAVVNTVIMVVKIVALLAVIFLFAIAFKWHMFTQEFWGNASLGSVLTQVKSTMLITVWDFLGIEAACIYAMRAKKMSDVAKATMWGVVVVLILDAAISLLPLGIMSQTQLAGLATPSSAGILSILDGAWTADFVKIAVIISVFGALLAWMMLATNIFFLSASDKTMPQWLTKLNHKKVPTNSLLVSCIALQLFVIIAYFTSSVYLNMIKLATSMVLLLYFFSALFAFKLIITDKQFIWADIIKGGIAVLYCVWLVYAGGMMYLVFSTMLYSVGIILYKMARSEQGKKLFSNKLEILVFLILISTAVISGVLWLSGYIVLD